MPALLALAAACTFGVADFLGGLATRKANVVAVALLTNLAGGVLAVVLVVVVGGEWSAATIGWGAAGGACGLAGLVLLYQGLATGPNRLVSPLAAVVAAVVPVAVGLALGERPGIVAVAGLCLTPPAVWLVAGGDLRSSVGSRLPLVFGTGAGLGFGTFFALLAQTPDDGGAVPLLTARLVSVALLVLAATATRPAVPQLDATRVALTAGSLDMAANGLFLWSTRDGDLAIVGALVSLFPATTVLLAVAVLGERLDRSQFAGLALAVTAAALLS